MSTPVLNTYFKTFKTDGLGQIFMTGILDVKEHSKVSVEIIQRPHAPVSMKALRDMGKNPEKRWRRLWVSFRLGPPRQYIP